MNIKSRLGKLEDDANLDGDEALCIFNTIYEGKQPGTIHSESALIVWNLGKPTTLSSETGETVDEFNAQVEAISKLKADKARELVAKT